MKRRIAIGKEAFSKRGELLRGKMKLELKEKNSKDSDLESERWNNIPSLCLEYGIVCRRNMDVEEDEHSTTGIV